MTYQNSYPKSSIYKTKHNLFAFILLFFIFLLQTGCGFQLQGKMNLAGPLKRMYLQSGDPYGVLARSLKDYLKMSNVELVSAKNEADAILVILQDDTAQDLLSVSGTTQTRQYNLKVVVVFEVTDVKGQIIVPPQTLSESETITIQSNQILGNSNEASLYYQQMRRTLAYAIMNRIASKDVTNLIENAYKHS